MFSLFLRAYLDLDLKNKTKPHIQVNHPEFHPTTILQLALRLKFENAFCCTLTFVENKLKRFKTGRELAATPQLWKLRAARFWGSYVRLSAGDDG